MRHRPYYLISFVLLLFLLPLSSYRAEVLDFGTPEHDFSSLRSDGVELFRSRDTSQDIRLQTASYLKSLRTWLYLDFEEETAEALHDKRGRFAVRRAFYLPSPNAHNGKRSALFNGPKHGVEIDLGQGIWDEQGYAQDFTIELWFYPLFLYRRNTLVEKTSFHEQKKGSFRIGIEKGSVFARFKNLFYDANGQARSLALFSNSKVKLKKWQHLALTYEAGKGRLVLYLNGKEQDVRFAKDKNTHGSWPMKFHDLDANAGLFIAKSFLGLVDEFRIADRALSPEKDELHISRYEALKVDFEAQTGRQKSGTARSQVRSLPKRQKVRFGNISVQGIEPKGTALDVYIRYAHHPFNADSQEPRWQRVKGGYLSLSSFRYFQWKAVLRSNPLGDSTPILKSLRMDYTPVQLPPAPRSLRLVRSLSKGRQVCLQWEYSPLQDDEVKSGYYIYYGLRPGEYMGRLEYYQNMSGKAKRIGYYDEKQKLNNMPMTEKEKNALLSTSEARNLMRNRIRILVTNQLIEKNLSLDRKKKLPFLYPNVNYYFAVSAYDEFGESELSNEVYAILRP